MTIFIENINQYVADQLAAGREFYLYNKARPVRARPAIIGETVVTKMSDGHIETSRKITGPDLVVITNPAGEEFVIDKQQLTERYGAPDKNGFHHPLDCPQEIMFITDDDIEFMAPWGEKMRIKKYGALNITNLANGYVYGIQPSEFNSTYVDYEAFKNHGKNSFKNLYPIIKPLADRAKVISFDVFDTLLFRWNPVDKDYITNPDDVFHLIEQHYEISGYAKSRIAAETRARKIAYANDTDIILDNVYELMAPNFKHVRDLEVKWEMDNVAPNLQMADCYHKLMSPDKTFVIASDMYLDQKTITTMLQTHGNIHRGYFTKMYVSGEVGATKATGKMYEHMVKKLGVRPHEILHIGDNKKSDFEMAKQMGLNAWHYTGPNFQR